MYSSARTRGVYHVYAAGSPVRSSAKTRGVLYAYEEMEAAVDGAMLLQRFKRRVSSNNPCKIDTSTSKHNGTKKRARAVADDDVSCATKQSISNRGKRARRFRTRDVDASTLGGVRALKYLRNSAVLEAPQVDMVTDAYKRGNSEHTNTDRESCIGRTQSDSPEGGASVTATGTPRTTEDDDTSAEERPRRVRPRLWIKRSPLDD